MPHVIFNPNRNRGNVMMLHFSWWRFCSFINTETAETATAVTVIKPAGHEGRKLGAIIQLLSWSLWIPVCFSTGALQRNRKNRYQKNFYFYSLQDTTQRLSFAGPSNDHFLLFGNITAGSPVKTWSRQIITFKHDTELQQAPTGVYFSRNPSGCRCAAQQSFWLLLSYWGTLAPSYQATGVRCIESVRFEFFPAYSTEIF